MKKAKSIYICQSCGYQSAHWMGRCPDCNAWSSLAEEQLEQSKSNRIFSARPEPITREIHEEEERCFTHIKELDRVLGGGVVAGSVILVGGDPGIGKSTLIMQMLAGLARSSRKVLYVSGEESARQIRMRANRLGAMHDDIFLATESRVESILAMCAEIQPDFVAVDSIQTMFSDEFPSAPGSVTQVREAAARLLTMAKRDNIPVVLIGHVTKDGAIAGPRVLEHMVDTVLYFEGDRGHAFRILRTVKNRYGSTNEIGVFEMKEEGLMEVDNPSEIFLAERSLNVSGSVVLPSMEGTRPILVEVQALVSPTSFGSPRRTAIGADQQRLALLTAVLEKKAGMVLSQHDIFLNIAGGIRIDEPALDLGVVGALASSLLDRPVEATTVMCGEVGLSGEVRAVSRPDLRMREASRLGFSKIILPRSNARRLKKGGITMKVVAVRGINELLEELFGN